MTTQQQQQDTAQEDDSAPFLERYKIMKILGEGSYGRVKLAYDLEMNRKVALKIINKSSIKKPEHITRIKREVRIMRLLNHPNIVKLFDVAETDKEIILSLEYIEGGELFDFIVSNPRLNEKIARRIFRQIISAVDYCHQSSVIHRDLKPENLLLDNQKNIKIIDFGFVNLYDPEDVLKTFCGSPFYASPEMILGKKYIGPEVDVWSMGVILFALLAGKLPFRDANVKDLYRKITTSSFELPSCVTKDSGNLICNMLKVDPHERATVDEVKNHIWVNVGCDGPPDPLIPPRPMPVEPLSKTTINTMRLYGFTDEEETKKAILSTPNHPAFLLYCLIREHDLAESIAAAATKKTSVLIEISAEQHTEVSTSSKGERSKANNSVMRRKSISAIVTTQVAPPARSNLKTLHDNVVSSSEQPADSSGAKSSHSSARRKSAINDQTASVSKTMNWESSPTASPKPTPVVLAAEADDKVSQSKTLSPTSSTTPVFESSKQLLVPTEAASSQRHRSLSVRGSAQKPTRRGSLLVPGAHEEFKALTNEPATRLFHLSVSEHSSATSQVETLANPNQSRTSITTKISHAFSKIINRSLSRRGSMMSTDVSATPRVSKNIYGVDTTSSKVPEDIIKELNRVFALNGVSSQWVGFRAHCEAPGVNFDIEICSINKTAMYGLELRRRKGSVWTYQTVCSSLISQLRL
ncbi:MAP/microtubule affinity-regulating kinase 3 [Chytriomyces hyalinus]|nr:MAP/microtubule affinity-regulating kinase 3 [Chytriomyces hyalinus]